MRSKVLVIHTNIYHPYIQLVVKFKHEINNNINIHTNKYISETNVAQPSLVAIRLFGHSGHTTAVVQDCHYSTGAQILADQVYKVLWELVRNLYVYVYVYLHILQN